LRLGVRVPGLCWSIRADVAYGVWFRRAYGWWQCPGGAAAAAGLAGMVEVAAVHGRANASLAVGYGYTGSLGPSWSPPPSPGHDPCRCALGGYWRQWRVTATTLGIARCDGPGAPGILFVVLLASETLRERLQCMGRVVS
jgi:simple sugar transport system permease protein